jgi:hypothetical protein
VSDLIFNTTTCDEVFYNGTELDEVYFNGTLVFVATTNVLEVGTDGTFGFLGYDVNGPYGNLTPVTWDGETVEGMLSTSAGFFSVLLAGNSQGATRFSQVKVKGTFAGGSNPRTITYLTSGGNFTYNPTAGSQSSYSWSSLPANDRIVNGNFYDITFKA